MVISVKCQREIKDEDYEFSHKTLGLAEEEALEIVI